MKVKEYREKKKFSHKYMADKMGISRVTYTNKENGRRNFTPLEILILEDVLGVSFRELFEDLKDT